jgi:serine phosphatase RsbU (regulator of sigma subunit)
MLEVKPFTDHMIKKVHQFVGGADQSDDLTLLTIQIK